MSHVADRDHRDSVLMRDGFSLGDGVYNFLESSFSAALLSIDLASSFFSLQFSSSSAFSRLESEITSPPFFAFQLLLERNGDDLSTPPLLMCSQRPQD